MHGSSSLVRLGSNSCKVLSTCVIGAIIGESPINHQQLKIKTTATTCNDMGDTRPSHHANSSASSFKNPWLQSKGLLESGQGIFNNFPLTLAKRLENHPALPVKVIEPDWGKDKPDEGRVKATWLGHAVSQNGTLVQNDESQWYLRGFWSNSQLPTIHQLNQRE